MVLGFVFGVFVCFLCLVLGFVFGVFVFLCLVLGFVFGVFFCVLDGFRLFFLSCFFPELFCVGVFNFKCQKAILNSSFEAYHL